MAKMRGIHPDFWTDSKVVSVSPLARLLFIGIWNQACDNGHVDDDGVQLKIRILPVDSCDVEALLTELIEKRLVIRGAGHIKVPNLPKRQRIDVRYLALCEHCEGDPDAYWSESDRGPKGRATRRAPVVHPSGAQRAPHDEGDGDGEGDGEMKVRGDEGDGEGEGAGRTATRKRATTPPKQGHRLPEGWAPDDDTLTWAANERPDLDLNTTLDRFRDYWDAQPGAKGRKLDWTKTFRNWVRNEHASRGRATDDRSPAQRNRDRLEAEWRKRSRSGGES